MAKIEKQKRLNEIKGMVSAFCDLHLNVEFAGYALKLCEKLGRMRKLSITRGRTEIWAAAIIYVIARLNFLFDPESENHITPDTICEFFRTKKSTVGNKATQIEKACDLVVGAEGYCSKEISDAFMFLETPEGLILPRGMLMEKELVIEVVEGEEAEELERLIDEQRRIEEQRAQERKARRSEARRKAAKSKKETNDDRQLSLFNDS